MDSQFFADVVRLPGAYGDLSAPEAAAHYAAAADLFRQSLGFLDGLTIESGERVLDIGAGYGFHCAYFARRGGAVVGVATHVTEKLQEQAARDGYQYRRGEMHQLDFPDQSFDLVWSHHSLEHSHSPLQALREWYRVLKPGGRLAVTVPPHKTQIVSGHFHTGWSVGQLLYLLGVAGYELRSGYYLEEGYNVRGVVLRPKQEFDHGGASWMFHLKDRLPKALQPLLQAQPGSLGRWSFPGRITFLNEDQCVLADDEGKTAAVPAPASPPAAPSPAAPPQAANPKSVPASSAAAPAQPPSVSPASATPAQNGSVSRATAPAAPFVSTAGPAQRNQILITLDSLRWDVFSEANTPFLKSLGQWKKAYTQATFTFPAHVSFFAGKLPQTDDQTDYYDTVAFRVASDGALKRQQQLYRLDNPEAPRRAGVTLGGRNIIEGFRRLGFATVGSGAVSWFNPSLPAGRLLSDPFEYYAFFDGPHHASHASARKQVQWARQTLEAIRRPYFLFLNFGETHHRFVHEGCAWYDAPFNYGDVVECKRRQRACLEFLDAQIGELLSEQKNYDVVICADHGEAMGEDGLWGHGFYHRSVMEVPMLIRVGDSVPA